MMASFIGKMLLSTSGFWHKRILYTVYHRQNCQTEPTEPSVNLNIINISLGLVYPTGFMLKLGMVFCSTHILVWQLPHVWNMFRSKTWIITIPVGFCQLPFWTVFFGMTIWRFPQTSDTVIPHNVWFISWKIPSLVQETPICPMFFLYLAEGGGWVRREADYVQRLEQLFRTALTSVRCVFFLVESHHPSIKRTSLLINQLLMGD